MTSQYNKTCNLFDLQYRHNIGVVSFILVLRFYLLLLLL